MTSSEALSLKIWEGVATLGFSIVLIGVVIEGVEHFKKFSKKEHGRKVQIEKVGWFLVVVGLAIEFLGDHAAKRISDREAARLNNEAGDARRIAGLANERAASLELRAADAELKLAEITNDVAKIDPLKHRISEVSAIMRYRGVFLPGIRRGTNISEKLNADLTFIDLTNLYKSSHFSGKISGMRGDSPQMWNFNSYSGGTIVGGKSPGFLLPILELNAVKSVRNGDEYVIQFELDRTVFEITNSPAAFFRKEVLGLGPSDSLENFARTINAFHSFLFSSNVNVDGIRDGSIELFLNNFPVTNFTIPPQKVSADVRGGAWEVDHTDELPPMP